jgi:uncharacterized protein YlxW (UPF0749 family)
LPILVIVGAALVGYLLAVSFGAGRTVALAEDGRHAELVALVQEQRQRTDALGKTLNELGADLTLKQDQAATNMPVLNDVIRDAELAAGITSVVGPGLTVTLFDAPADCTGAPYLCRVQDYDLQLAVNTLFAAGAEAVAVGGQRVIATTAIRAAGSQITANYQFLTSPYEIRAIGDASALADAIAFDGLAVAFEATGSGLRVETDTSSEVRIPGLGVAPVIRIAQPVAGAG